MFTRRHNETAYTDLSTPTLFPLAINHNLFIVVIVIDISTVNLKRTPSSRNQDAIQSYWGGAMQR